MSRTHWLVPGNCYFRLTYFDSALLIPSIRTFVLEEATVVDGQPVWVFREPTVEGNEPPRARLLVDEWQIDAMLDLPRLRQALREPEALHPLHPLPAVPAPRPASAERTRDLLRPQVARLLAAGDGLLHMTIRFTSVGLSLMQTGGQTGLSSWVHWRVEPEQEQTLRAVFRAFGLAPCEDRLTDRNRVRHLGYRLPDDAKVITSLCTQLLLQVYGLREDDELVFRHES